MNKCILILVVFISNFCFGQSEDVKELWKINKKYDSILINYQNKAKDSLSNLSKKERMKIIGTNEIRINKKRRAEELFLLDKINNSEGNQFKNYTPTKTFKCDDIAREIVSFNKKLKSNYKATETNNSISNFGSNNEPLTTTLTFVVSEEGYISDVKATGNNTEFNKENILTLYKAGRWTPKCSNGYTEASRFRMPVTMKFDR